MGSSELRVPEVEENDVGVAQEPGRGPSGKEPSRAPPSSPLLSGLCWGVQQVQLLGSLEGVRPVGLLPAYLGD